MKWSMIMAAVLALFPLRAGNPATHRTGSVSTDQLPLTEVPAAAPGQWLALFMTGDGGYVSADRQLTRELSDSGIAVLVLDSRAYLARRPTPDQASRDVATAITEHLERWSRSRVLLIGSSRGADLLPFIANRFPDTLRNRVDLMVLFALGRWASFQFHFIDLFMDRHRSSDLPVSPELERLRGTRILCLYGAGDDGSFCNGADSTLVDSVVAGSGHRLKGETAAEIVQLILRDLPVTGR